RSPVMPIFSASVMSVKAIIQMARSLNLNLIDFASTQLAQTISQINGVGDVSVGGGVFRGRAVRGRERSCVAIGLL
ncbi:hypothetical protein ABKW02_24265, partial [Enterobacter cloacae]